MTALEQTIMEKICNADVEWKALGDVADIEKGKQLNKSLLTEAGDYPVINGGINPSGYWHEFNNEANTIVISQGGASAGYVNWLNVPFFAGAHAFVVKPNEKWVLNRYVYHFLKMNQKFFMEKQYGAGIPALAKADLVNFQIPIPPLQLQLDIVKILDVLTELQAGLQAELILRNKQYKYYREKLLNNSENAVWKALGDVGELIRGNGLQKKDFTETGVPAIHYGQIYTYYGTVATKTKSFVSATTAEKLKKANYGDVLIAGTSENVEDVMKPLAWLGGEIVFSGDMFAYRPNKNLNTKFITYLLQTENFQKYKEKYAQGTKVIRMKSENFLKYKIPVPPLAEQERIVAILDKFDALTNSISDGLPKEIELRRKQYEYYREKLLSFAK